MKKKGPLFSLVMATVLMYGLQSCSKSNSAGIETIYNTWTFTHSHGMISVNGNPLAVSESSNTSGSVTVQFQKAGSYQYRVGSFIDETGAFSFSDSTIGLASDSSFFANFCAYPIVYFTTTPNPDLPIKRHVSRSLEIIYVSRDSLLLSSRMTRPGNDAPDTVYTEFTGFKK